MKTTIIEPYAFLTDLKDLLAGQTFRWGDKDDTAHEHVCIVLNVDNGGMVIKNLTTDDIFIRRPYGDDAGINVNRLRITSIEATL